MKNKNSILAFFLFLLGAIITLLAILIPRWTSAILLVIIIIVAWIIYDRFIVYSMGWELIWWSPHIKRLNLDSFVKEYFEPEMVIVSYFLQNEFKRYQRIPLKEGFILAGRKKKLRLVARYTKEHLEVRFFPMFSKKSIDLMENFKKFVSNIRITKA